MTPSADAQPTIPKRKGNKRMADESDEEPKVKKSKLVDAKVTKRKASADEDIEAPQLKKSKTTAKPITKPPTTKTAPKNAATLKKPAAPKPAPTVSEFLTQLYALASLYQPMFLSADRNC